MIYTCPIHTPLGTMTAAAEDGALTGLWFTGQKYYPTLTARWIRKPDHPVFASLRNYLGSYFSGIAATPDIPLDPQGSPFQKTVWRLLSSIPRGQVATYGQIAGHIARSRSMASMSAQAVGGAVGHNPISILIPCHRVVGSKGSLTGYAGGLEKKAALLRIEDLDAAELDASRFCSFL